jgi:GAF domain-containing protein
MGRSFAIRVAASWHASAGHARVSTPARDWVRESINPLLRARIPATGRLAEIDRLDLFSPTTRHKLDKAAHRAAARLGTPIGLVTIVLDGAREFTGRHGFAGWVARAGGPPVEWSVCATMVGTPEPHLVPDVATDVDQRHHSMVAHDSLGSYAGVPLITSCGEVLGSYCVASALLRTYTHADVATLQVLASEIITDLEQDQSAST